MAIPLPRPTAVFGLTRSALDQAASFAAVPTRAFAVLDGVEALLARINGVVDRIEGTLDRTDRVLDDAESAVREVAVISAAATTAIDSATEVAAAAAVVVGEAERVSAAALSVVADAEKVAVAAAETTTTAAGLLAAYEPALRRGAPMADRFVAELSQEEVTAAIRLVDELPKLKEHLTADVLPILATLDRVGPDLHDLLDVTRDLKLAVAGIPGLGMLRRRGERLNDDPES
ncbi:hypothetical protein [Micromonospora siamensis]|uniref:Ribulose 1,5-bisphosphate carboxylase large subunit n=1 Tax=Micromonospora siamensis TaxID=299152 RepID=A0A1C5HK52_9ACTN|nr:hypothetical protein [Micromonospora siamensis]SCG46429.1 hypothetical protein GA0074704_1887 [Micromonospora siamensis]